MNNLPANDQHRAKPWQWETIERKRYHAEFSVILELLHRIEALETRNEDDKEAWAAMRRAGSSATERIGALTERIDALEASATAQPSRPASPGGSLLLRVACADGPADAICEVAAWFREQGGPIALEWAIRLELEAEG